MLETEAFPEKANIAADLTEPQRDSLVSLANERWAWSTTEIQELIEASRLAWDYYLSNVPNASTLAAAGPRDGYAADLNSRKGLRLPNIPIAVESILATQHNTTFPGDDRFFRGSPENEFAEENQEIIESFMAENFGVANTSEAFRQLRLNLILDGTACLATRWKVKKNPRKVDYEPVFNVKIPTPFGNVGFALGGVKQKKSSDIEWEGTEAVPLDFNDWRVDPAARSMDESWFMRRWYVPVHEVKEAFPDAQDVRPFVDLSSDSYGNNQKREVAGLKALNQVLNPEIEEDGRKNCLLMVCYDDFVIDDVVYPGHVLVTLNGSELLHFGPNEYNHGRVPYIVGPYNPIPGQIYGLSAVIHAIPSAASIDKGVDNILRASTWTSNPIILKNVMDSGVQQHGTIRVRPGVHLPVADLNNSYKQMEVNVGNVGPVMEMVKVAEDKLMRVIGNSPMMEGSAPEQGRVSAFEIDQRVQGSSGRTASLLKVFDNYFLEPFMVINYENRRQFMKAPVKINGQEVTPDMVKLAKFKWIIVSTQATMSRAREIANKRAFLVELLPSLVQAGAVKLKAEVAEFDLIQYVRELMIKGGEKDVDRHLKVIPGAVPEMMGPVDVEQDSEVAGEQSAVPPTPNDARSELPPSPGG